MIDGRRLALRRQIDERKPLVIPGTGDPLGARLIQKAGFRAMYMSGFAVEGSYGFPDIGLLSMTEIARRAADIADAANIPLVADFDTGYGNTNNVIRAVREFERAGVAAIQIEDQTFPKKCGAMAGKKVVERAEMVGRIKAAVDTRLDSNLLIIGRTDAVAVEGLESGLERMHLYAEAGADLVMVHGPYEPDVVKRLGQEAPRPLVYLNSEPLTMPMLPVSQLSSMGINIVVFPISILLTAVRAMAETLEVIARDGTTRGIMGTAMIDWNQFNDLVGLREIIGAEKKYV